MEKNWSGTPAVPLRIKDVLEFDEKVAKAVWEDVDTNAAKVVLLTAGFPCKDLSALNVDGQGLHGKSSGLFYHVLRVLELLRKTKPENSKVQVHFVIENVLSMEKSWQERISLSLGAEALLLDPSGMGWCKRPRLHWSSFPIVQRDGERYYSMKGVQGLDVRLEKRPLEEHLDQ